MKLSILLASVGVIAAQSAGAATPALDLATARQMAKSAEAVMQDHGLGGVVVIVDADDRVVTYDRVAGGILANDALARQKAHTAVAFGVPTQQWVDKLAQGNMTILGNSEIVPLPGGAPLLRDGTLIGAVGVATPKGTVDAEAASAAVAVVSAGTAGQ